MRRCFGEPEPGTCDNQAGPRNPVWCDDCDRKRVARISKQFDSLLQHFEAATPEEEK